MKYTEKEEKELQQLSRQLWDTVSQELNQNVGSRIEYLKKVINYHDWRYYVQNDNVVADMEYDTLFKQLRNLEEEHPDLATSDSPTQRVARGLTEGFESVRHSVPMLSLDNSYNAEDLLDFDRKVRELTGQEDITYAVEPKFDGSSIALLYEDDQLVRAATRGDGTMGEEITNNAKVIRSIPLSAPFSEHGIRRIELRGEVVIANDFFDKMNEEREANGLSVFQNTRNTASGGLRMKDPQEVSKRGLEAFIYQVGYAVDAEENSVLGNKLTHHDQNIEWLHSLGFKTPTIEKTLGDINAVIAFCKTWEEKRESYAYEIDGMVVKVDDLKMQDQVGATGHHPRWAIAFKFKAKQATSILENVEYQVGRTGAVTPVAKIRPVRLAGVTISSISLHNADFIAEKDIQLNDTVLIERAGDVIPYVVGPVVSARRGEETPIDYPTECPSCSTPLVRPEEEAIWRCVNAECPAQAEERLIHFVSKGAMDIEGLGKDIVKRFVAEGFIANIHDIYELNYDEVLALDGWKQRSVDNLRNGVEASKSKPLWKFIVALGIRHVGGQTAKMLAKKVANILDLQEWTVEQLVELDDVGPKVAESIHDFFQNEQNIKLIERLAENGVSIIRTEAEEPKSDILADKTFLFTGTLEQFSRDKAKQLVEENGGKTVSSVSKKLNYLVVGASPGSKLAKAEKLGTITVMTETEFLEMIAD